MRPSGISLIVLRSTSGHTETLLLRRAGATFNGAWCQVAGGIDENEKAWETAIRELREETGLAPTDLYSAGICEQFYDAQHECIYVAPVFVAFVEAHAAVTLNSEHSEYRWVGLDDLDEYLETPNQREMFATVRRHFVEGRVTERSRINLES